MIEEEIDLLIKEECNSLYTKDELPLTTSIFSYIDKIKVSHFKSLDSSNLKIQNSEFQDNFLNFKKERRKLILSGDYTIEEAELVVSNKYNIESKISNSTLLKELIYSYYYLYFIIKGDKIPNKLNLYYKNNLEFKERTYIRIKCLKSGWSYKTIENLLKRYYKDYEDYLKLNVQWMYIFYYCLICMLNLHSLKYFFQKGRPKIDPNIKKIINKYIIRKSVEKVKLYKTKADLIDSFTKKDIEDIYNSCSNDKNIDIHRKKEILDKLDNLHKLCI
jgi:hypothetical protein